jgi:uncharacterized protein YdhG (YjbR/CyaY superfamily)
MPMFESMDDYLDSLTNEQREVIEEIDRLVLTVAPGAERVIRYDIPTWQVAGQSLVHAAAWQNHVAVYPVPPAGDEELDRELQRHIAGKGTLKFHYGRLPYNLIERVVKRLLDTRG